MNWTMMDWTMKDWTMNWAMKAANEVLDNEGLTMNWTMKDWTMRTNFASYELSNVGL